MPQAAALELPQAITNLLQWLGVTSLAGAVGFWSTWAAFPPELVIESVTDKSKTSPIETRLKVKNTGKLPAWNCVCEMSDMNATLGGISFTNCRFGNMLPQLLQRVSAGESTEIPTLPGWGIAQGMQLSAVNYTLLLTYEARLFFLKKKFQKKWKIELRRFEDGYSWNVTLMQ